MHVDSVIEHVFEKTVLDDDPSAAIRKMYGVPGCRDVTTASWFQDDIKSIEMNVFTVLGDEAHTLRAIHLRTGDMDVAALADQDCRTGTIAIPQYKYITRPGLLCQTKQTHIISIDPSSCCFINLPVVACPGNKPLSLGIKDDASPHDLFRSKSAVLGQNEEGIV